MAANLVLAVLGLTKEQWNGPSDAERCGDLLATWRDNFDAGERAFFLQSQSFICGGVDCDEDGGFDAKYKWKCAAKGAGGVGSLDIADPYVGLTVTSHQEKTKYII